MALTAAERMRRYREKKRIQRTQPRPCLQCRNNFTPQRTTALYCSNACRQRAFLKKQKAMRLRKWYAPPKWSEGKDEGTVIAQVKILDVKGPC